MLYRRQLSFTAVLLASVPWAMAQTGPGNAPPENGAGAAQAPVLRQPARSAKGGFVNRGKAPAKAGSDRPAEIPPNTPVVTLQGVCKEQTPKPANGACKTFITRDDLERFISAFAPEGGESARGRMAVQYAKTVAFSALAEKQGLDKNPVLAAELDFQLKLIRMRMLSSAFLQVEQRKVKIEESEIGKYYEEHRDQYEQVQVRRLAIPMAAPNESGRTLERSAVMAEMEGLRKRAAAGEDMNQLQQEGFKDLRIQATPPPVIVTALRRTNVQGDEAKVFDMNAGEISAVLDLPAAFAIIKVESKEGAPIGSVRQEIETALRRERVQDEISEAAKQISAQFNLQYLELPSQPNIFSLSNSTAAAPTPAANTAAVRRTPIRPRQQKAASIVEPSAGSNK